jgi:hypothetical protein
MLSPRTVADDTQPRHDPSSNLKAFLELRDVTCLGIGCSCSARRSDKDHEQRWPDGPTAAWNLSSKSPRCHHAAHHGWQMDRTDTGPHAGSVIWTSPLGHAYPNPASGPPPTGSPTTSLLPAPRLQPLDDTHTSPWEIPLVNDPKPAPHHPDVTTIRTWNDDWNDNNHPSELSRSKQSEPPS